MANPSFISALKSDRCVHYLNNFLVNRAQSIDVSANVPSQIIDELGNDKHTGIISAPAEVSFNVSVFDTGIELGRSLTEKPSATNFTLDDYISAQVDYVGVVRDNTGNFFRSVYVKNASINRVGYAFDISGNATESYGFVGDNMTVFDGFVVTKKYTITAADVTNGYFTLGLQGAEAPIKTKSDSYFEGAYLLRVTKSASGKSTTLVEANDYTYIPASKRVSASGMIAGEVWTVVFYSAVMGTALAPSFNSSAPPAVRGEFTPVSIGVSSKTWIPRLQSARIDIALQQNRIPQLGSNKVIFAPGGVPNVSGNFNVLMNDLSLRKLLTYGATSSAETQFGIEQLPTYGINNNLGLEVVVKSPKDNSVLKRIVVPDIVTNTGGMPANVNGTLMETFGWTGKSGGLAISNS